MADEGLLIEEVVAGSIAEELEIESGDRLLMVNGQPLRDIIDYNFHASDDELLFLVKKGNGDLWELEFDRIDGEPIGLIFSTPQPVSCGNNCIFCFVHQMPRGMRKPLYVKDEDYRLSFLYGNYVTLTNITPAEIERIIEQRLSPLYISVHATDPELREQLLGRKGLPPILKIMGELAAARIFMHTQVVLCPGINDGTALEKTVSDLEVLRPYVASLAIVPLGLTRHRRGLPELAPVGDAYARDFVSVWAPRMSASDKEPFLFLADEFFVKAGADFPPLERYGDLPQLENGVGMIPLFMAEAGEVLAIAEPLTPCRITVVTGLSPLPWVADFLDRLGKITGVVFRAVAVPNILFGDQVTVTGLVCGQDIVSALQGTDAGDLLLIPEVMLKEGEGLFLDDMDLDGIAAALGCRAESFPATPDGLYQKLVALSDSEPAN